MAKKRKRKKERPGVKWKVVGGVKRKVRVKANGQWVFMKTPGRRKGARCPKCKRKF